MNFSTPRTITSSAVGRNGCTAKITWRREAASACDGRSTGNRTAKRRTGGNHSGRAGALGRCAFGLAFALLVVFAEPGAGKTLKVATTSPASSSWVKTLKAANEELKAVTEGRLAFRIYADGRKGRDDTVVLRKIGIGELHGGLVTAAVFQRIYPDMQIYNLPMAFRDLAEVDAIRERMDSQLLAGLDAAGFECFGIAEVGMAYPMSVKPVRTVADGRRLKVWSPQGDVAAARTLEAFGISPISLTIADVAGGLSSGLIDTVAVPPVAVLPLQWHTRLKYVVDLPIMYIYGTFVVDKKTLRDVAQSDLEAMRRIMGAAVAQADRQNRGDHERVLEALRNVGLQFIALTPEEQAGWREFAEAAAARWVKEGVIGADIHKTLKEHLAAIRAATP